METLEELQKILDDKPVDGSHYSKLEKVYYKFSCECWMWCPRGSNLFHFVQDDDCVIDDLSSLSDIRRIVDLKVALNSAWESINEAGYEDFNNELSDFMSEEL